MEAGIEIVKGSRRVDDPLRRRRIQDARIGEGSHGRLQFIEMLHAAFVGDRQENDLPPFLGTADGEYFHPR